VLQALYFCKPFREHVLNYRLTQKNKKENLLTCLADLFHMIINGKRRTGALQPKKFINKLRKENSKHVKKQKMTNKIDIFTGTFDNDMQQDAHEFLNHLLNTCGDILLGKTMIILSLIYL
jgi:ubiquitin carboxyl-terminal hydrolase 12/46